MEFQVISLFQLREEYKSESEVKVAQFYPTLCDLMDYPGQNTGVGSLSLLQGIFSTQGSNPGLPHRRQILYQLSHKGNQEYWSGQPIFPTQKSNQGLLHCRQILYQLSYQGSLILFHGGTYSGPFNNLNSRRIDWW